MRHISSALLSPACNSSKDLAPPRGRLTPKRDFVNAILPSVLVLLIVSSCKGKIVGPPLEPVVSVGGTGAGGMAGAADAGGSSGSRSAGGSANTGGTTALRAGGGNQGSGGGSSVPPCVLNDSSLDGCLLQ